MQHRLDIERVCCKKAFYTHLDSHTQEALAAEEAELNRVNLRV